MPVIRSAHCANLNDVDLVNVWIYIDVFWYVCIVHV